MDIDGLTRSSATDRDRVRRRLLLVSTAAGVAAVATTGALTVALVPVTVSSVSATSPTPAVTSPAAAASPPAAPATLSATSAQPQAPVATSGGS
ncbi:MAG: hypothetical protein JWN87_282 [Frankiales bacterium]|nr:hypothetical protein [Frankiales bacterium]